MTEYSRSLEFPDEEWGSVHYVVRVSSHGSILSIQRKQGDDIMLVYQGQNFALNKAMNDAFQTLVGYCNETMPFWIDSSNRPMTPKEQAAMAFVFVELFNGNLTIKDNKDT